MNRLEFADVDIAELRRWVGKTETVSDQITPVPIAALRATLDIEAPPPRPGDPLPPLWHWLYFLPDPPAVRTWSGGSHDEGWFPAARAVAAPHVGRRPL